jgi:hypothetical protein
MDTALISTPISTIPEPPKLSETFKIGKNEVKHEGQNYFLVLEKQLYKDWKPIKGVSMKVPREPWKSGGNVFEEPSVQDFEKRRITRMTRGFYQKL